MGRKSRSQRSRRRPRHPDRFIITLLVSPIIIFDLTWSDGFQILKLPLCRPTTLTSTCLEVETGRERASKPKLKRSRIQPAVTSSNASIKHGGETPLPPTNQPATKQVSSRNSTTSNKAHKTSHTSTSTPQPQRKHAAPQSPAQQQGNIVALPNMTTQLNYARNGHCVLRNMIDSERFELAKLRADLLKYAHQQELLAWQQKIEVAAPSSIVDASSLASTCRTVEACRQILQQWNIPVDSLPFLQYFHTWRKIPAVLDLARALAPTAAALMDVPTVRLYQDSLFWKRPGDGPTPWHTDARMAPFDTSHLITLWIPLQPVPRFGTGLEFCSKSHADFALPFWHPFDINSDKGDSPWNRLEERYEQTGGYFGRRGNVVVDYMPLRLGDVTAHSGWTLHAANPNVGTEDRLALAISYVHSHAWVRADVQQLVRKQRQTQATSSVKSASTKATAAMGSYRGDSEDTWSYRDWVTEVPSMTSKWDHPLVPVLWPTKNTKPTRPSQA